MIDPFSRYLHAQAGEHGPVMLMYHSVQPGKARPAWPWAISMQALCAQLDFLAAEGYSTPTMGELAAQPANKWAGRTAVITFDDGYVDNLAAFEALHKRGMRATCFMVTGSIGKEPNWPADGRPAVRLLNCTELRELHVAGMEIASHTVNHARLTELDDDALREELRQSKAMLEDTLDGPIGSFAYPYGACDERCVAAVAEAGYTAACTTRTGWALRDNDPYKLRRLTVFNTDSLGSFARKLYFGSHDVGWRDLAGYALRRLLRA